MEPDDLNEFTKNDRRLEALLRQSSAPLADDGFSSRVLASLPSSTPRRSPYRLAACLIGAIAGLAVAYFFNSNSVGGNSVVSPDQLWEVISDSTFLLAVAIAGGSLILAFEPRVLWQRLVQG